METRTRKLGLPHFCTDSRARTVQVIVTDERTHHEALPVVKGLKFAANFWIHLYDFQAFHALGCDNRNYLQTDTLARRGAPPNHRSKGYSTA